MNRSTLAATQLGGPLRVLALSVEETEPGYFYWRILERFGEPEVFESVAVADAACNAYDKALATGYGELQRLVGPDLQFGPRDTSKPADDLFAAVPRR